MVVKKLTVGVLAGVIAGVVGGILTAPKAGRENRLAIKTKALELKDKVVKLAEQPKK